MFLFIAHGLTFHLQYFMEAYQAYKTPEAFWAEFSDSRGWKLKYSPIKKILLDQQKDAVSELAKKVKKEYGNNFINYFGYTKDKVWKPMIDALAIVQLYRKIMKISCNDNDV